MNDTQTQPRPNPTLAEMMTIVGKAHAIAFPDDGPPSAEIVNESYLKLSQDIIPAFDSAKGATFETFAIGCLINFFRDTRQHYRNVHLSGFDHRPPDAPLDPADTEPNHIPGPWDFYFEHPMPQPDPQADARLLSQQVASVLAQYLTPAEAEIYEAITRAGITDNNNTERDAFNVASRRLHKSTATVRRTWLRAQEKLRRDPTAAAEIEKIRTSFVRKTPPPV
jgi:hypothetical protein